MKRLLRRQQSRTNEWRQRSNDLSKRPSTFLSCPRALTHSMSICISHPKSGLPKYTKFAARRQGCKNDAHDRRRQQGRASDRVVPRGMLHVV